MLFTSGETFLKSDGEVGLMLIFANIVCFTESKDEFHTRCVDWSYWVQEHWWLNMIEVNRGWCLKTLQTWHL